MKYETKEITVTSLGKIKIKNEKWTDPGGNKPNGAGSPARPRTYTAIYSPGGIILEDLHDPLMDYVDAQYDDFMSVAKLDVVVRKDGSVRVDLIHEDEDTFAEDLEDVCKAVMDSDCSFKVRQKAKKLLTCVDE